MHRTREDQATAELGTTEITPGVARTLVVTIAATLLAVPLLQWGDQLYSFSTGQRDSPWPDAAEILTAPGVALHGWSQSGGNLGRKTLAANAELLAEIHRYETALEDNSNITTTLLGPTRTWLARWAGWGTEEAWIGHDGWVFYRPDLQYSIGPGFLDPDVLARRRRGGLEFSRGRHPDPRPAILDFARQLADRNIQLVLVPTPHKAMVHPEKFGRHNNSPTPPHNRSWPGFLETLQAPNLTIFDPLPVLAARHRRDDSDQYLATDTHWTPGAMEAVAEALAGRIVELGCLDSNPQSATWVRESQEVSQEGELVTMMRMSPGAAGFNSETVTVQAVLHSDRSPWRPDTTAEVILLGDSYTNIYSYDAMGWGKSAGFAEQLSWHLQRPVDRIARNADGAHATRRQLGDDTNRLTNTRVLVWQFAVRELSGGDWPLVHIGAPPHVPDSTKPLSGTFYRGTVLATSGVPAPGTVPYRDAVLSLHVKDNSGGQRILFCMGMKNNKLTSAARLKPGDTLTARLIPWTTVQETRGRLNRIELDDPDFRLLELPTYWGDLE
ncbi:MAG TPA: hypothetical protein DCE43_00420 [Planctomycetaceae bacterium]|nr:hypothetical protein [Planctomycetaceae bacterium]